MKQINKCYIIIIINTIPSIERIYTQRTFLNSITILLFIKIMIHTRISSKSKFECKNLYVLKNTFYQHQTLALIYQAKRIVYSYMLRSLLVRRIKVHHFRHFVARLFFLFFFFFLNEFLVPRHRTSGYAANATASGNLGRTRESQLFFKVRSTTGI